MWAEKEEVTGEEAKGAVASEWIPQIKSKENDVAAMSWGATALPCPPLSILPRQKNERCGRRTVGVMGKRSDGDKQKKRRKEYREWPWEDCRRGRDVNEKVKKGKKKKQENQWGREEKEDKRWCFNELILTVGDVRSSPRFKGITREVCTFYLSFKAVPTCWISGNEDEMRKPRPGI